MIDPAALLKDTKKLLATLEADIRDQAADDPAATKALEAEWQAARDARRTAQSFAEWREGEITQAAVHWVLACVFCRFVEDNHLVERPWLAGPSRDRMALAKDRSERYFRANPVHSDRDYLEMVFAEAADLPGLSDLFDRRHNPMSRLPVSGDGGRDLLEFFRRWDPDSNRLVHNFDDPAWETRFLGDLYQDLSEAARKRYALLQTPGFVESFILDRTLTPAIEEFGFRAVRMIDPTCGSGHFLLGGFQRLQALWAAHEPGRNGIGSVQQALDQVYGVDLNPFAVAIARFRLLVAALRAAGITRLKEAPAFRMHVAVGDSLLHGSHFGHLTLGGELDNAAKSAVLRHVYACEDAEALTEILGQQYHAVVGNPPYITPKDAALNQAYRWFYPSCHMKYALAVPFIERFYDLALDGRRSAARSAGVSPAFDIPSAWSAGVSPAKGGPEARAPSSAPNASGFVGLIVANSFMKREFG